MKAIVVYYSLSGNTEFAAQEIVKMLSADMLRIEPEKAYPKKGFAKFFFGGGSSLMAEKRALKPYDFAGESYDTVILGFPLWAGRVTPPLRTFLEEQKEALKGKRFAAFVCQSGSGAKKALQNLKETIGTEAFAAEMVLIDPKTRPSEENQKKIEVFCKALQEKA